VLPFTTSDVQSEYVGEGLTGTVTNELAQLPGLRVMAETTANRYRGRSDVAAAGREMNVDAVLTGRLDGPQEKGTFSAEFVHVATRAQLWSTREVLAGAGLPDVARTVARSIGNRLQLAIPAPTEQRLTRSASDDAEA
jgi:TolB-like protein